MLSRSKIFFLSVALILFSANIFGQDLGSSNTLFRSPKSKPKSDSAPAKKPAPKKTIAAKFKSKTAVKSATTARAAGKTNDSNKTASVKKTPDSNKTSNSDKAANSTKTASAKTVNSTKTANFDKAANSNKPAASNRAESADKSPVRAAPPNKTNVITVAQPVVEDFSEEFEQAIEEGNQARDARDYARAEAAYLQAQKFKNTDFRAVYGLGNLFSDQQRWEEAERAYRAAIALEPESPETHIALGFVLTQPIAGTNLSERYAEAVKTARRAVALDTQNALAYDQLGVALELSGEIGDETQNAYRKAIQLDSTFALAYAHLGKLLSRFGKANDSATAYRTAIGLATDVPTMILIADVMQSQQRYEESESLLRRALRQDPKHPTALFLLGRALTARDVYDEAETVLKKSAEVSPNGFVAFMLLGSLYARQNKFDAAEKSLMRALKIVSPNERKRLAQEFEAVGDGYLRARQTKNAARVYRQAIELDAERPILSTKLAEAQKS